MKKKTKILLLVVSAALVLTAVVFGSVSNVHQDLPFLPFSEFESLLLSESKEHRNLQSVTVETGNQVIQIKLKGKPPLNLTVPDDKRTKIFEILHEKGTPIILLGRK
ncbi:MAG: hypothetical protein IT342_21915 [Candidatus Melainabacteria bacterium]|nr:hypothetical protein [Candidatus Melainabacteria bacterium]